jgi:dephospho-CoA kinase
MASGKSTVVEALKNQEFKHTTLSDQVREEAKKRGLAIEREQLMEVGQDLREQFGAGVLAARALKKIKAEGGGKWIVDGIRNPAEVLELRKDPDFILIANIAPESLIISRILSRKRADDTLDENTIRHKLRREMGEGEPPEGQQVQKCIDMADYVFENVMKMNEVEEEFMKLYNKINQSAQ